MEEKTNAAARPTLKTIALATGFAVPTVGRALKNAPDIAAETKRIVKAKALELGYRPNRAGVRLRTGKTNVIALLLSTEHDGLNHTSRLISAIAGALRGTQYHLVILPFFPDQDPMEPVRYVVETESADGLILNQTLLDDPRVAYLTAQGFPFVTHGRTDMGIDHRYFDYDNEAFARLMVRQLARRGRRHLLLVAPPFEHAYAGFIVTGFMQECAAQGVVGEVLRSVTAAAPFAAIEAAVAARFRTDPRPDGVLAAITTAALAAVAAGEGQGLRLGQDFDVASKEVLHLLRQFRKDILVVHEDVTKAGTFLSQAVMAAIEGGDPKAHQALDRPTLQDIE